MISFDRYSRQDLIEIADAILLGFLKKAENSRQDTRLFHKILNNAAEIPYPGDLVQLIKTSVAFADIENEFDYLRKFYLALNNNPTNVDIQDLQEKGYTTREIEIITGIPRSSVSRKLKG